MPGRKGTQSVSHGYDDATGVMVEHLGGRTASPIGENRSHRTPAGDDQLLNDQLLGLLTTAPLRR